MREPGFYWIILDGKPVVAEYRLVGSGLSKFPIGACWIYGDKIIKIDKPTDEPITVLSERLPEPSLKNTPKEHYCCERSTLLRREERGDWKYGDWVINFCPFCAVPLTEPKSEMRTPESVARGIIANALVGPNYPRTKAEMDAEHKRYLESKDEKHCLDCGVELSDLTGRQRVGGWNLRGKPANVYICDLCDERGRLHF